MSIPSLGPASPTTAPAGGTGSGDQLALGVDKEAFLKLLVAQLRYQNPTSPVDGKEYVAQMAQFAQVEKLDALYKAQTEATVWQQALVGTGLVGREVTGQGPDGVVTAVATGVTFGSKGAVLQLEGGGTMAVVDVARAGRTGVTGTA